MKTAYIPINEQALERVKDAVDFKAIQIADEGELLYKKMFYQNGICFEPAYREYVNYRVSVKVNEPKKERLVCDEIKELEKKVEDLEFELGRYKQEERMMRFAEWLLDENKAHWCDLKKEHEYFLDNVENKK